MSTHCRGRTLDVIAGELRRTGREDPRGDQLKKEFGRRLRGLAQAMEGGNQTDRAAAKEELWRDYQNRIGTKSSSLAKGKGLDTRQFTAHAALVNALREVDRLMKGRPAICAKLCEVVKRRLTDMEIWKWYHGTLNRIVGSAYGAAVGKRKKHPPVIFRLADHHDEPCWALHGVTPRDALYAPLAENPKWHPWLAVLRQPQGDQLRIVAVLPMTTPQHEDLTTLEKKLKGGPSSASQPPAGADDDWLTDVAKIMDPIVLLEPDGKLQTGIIEECVAKIMNRIVSLEPDRQLRRGIIKDCWDDELTALPEEVLRCVLQLLGSHWGPRDVIKELASSRSFESEPGEFDEDLHGSESEGSVGSAEDDASGGVSVMMGVRQDPLRYAHFLKKAPAKSTGLELRAACFASLTRRWCRIMGWDGLPEHTEARSVLSDKRIGYGKGQKQPEIEKRERKLYEAIIEHPDQLDKDLAENLERTPQAFNDDKRRLEGRLAQLGALLLYMGDAWELTDPPTPDAPGWLACAGIFWREWRKASGSGVAPPWPQELTNKGATEDVVVNWFPKDDTTPEWCGDASWAGLSTSIFQYMVSRQAPNGPGIGDLDIWLDDWRP